MLSLSSANDELHELADNVERWQDDPVAFVREVIGASPDEWQQDALWDLRDFGRVSIAACHGPGKDALAAWAVLWCLYCFEHPKVPCTAPTSPQLRDLLWAEIAKWHGKMPPFFASMLEIKSDRIEYKEHAKTWFAVARTARPEKPEALAGFHADVILVVVDEASGVALVHFEVLEGAMTGEVAMMLVIGNPTQTSGYFFDTHHGDRDRWRTYRVYAAAAHQGDKLAPGTYLSRRVSAEYVRAIAKKYGTDSNVYRVRVMGLFPKSDDDAVIPYEWLEAARARDVDERPRVHYVSVGLDVARFGSDDCAMATRQGPVTLHLADWHGHDEDYTAGRLLAHCKDLVERQRLPLKYVFIDAAGVGAGVVKRARAKDERGRNWYVDHGVTIVAVQVGMKSPDRECKLLRDALWWRARKVFDPRGGGDRLGGLPRFHPSIEPEHIARLVGELSQPKYTFTGPETVSVERKDDMKDRGLASPDMADAWNLTLYIEAGMPDPKKAKRWYDETDDDDARFMP